MLESDVVLKWQSGFTFKKKGADFCPKMSRNDFFQGLPAVRTSASSARSCEVDEQTGRLKSSELEWREKGGKLIGAQRREKCWIGRLRRFAFSPFQLIDSRLSLISEFRRGKFDAGGAGREFHRAWRPNTPLSHDNTKDTVLPSAQPWRSPWLIWNAVSHNGERAESK